MRHTAALLSAALALSLGGCAPPDGPVPAPLAPARDGLLLGAAGVPQGTFGDQNAPDFAAGFASLSADGFDAFLPIFLTSEDGAGTAEPSFFLPPAALPGIDAAITCANGEHNPWAVAGDVGLILPAYLLALDQAYSAPLDPLPYQARLRSFIDVCLGGDESKLRSLYLHDEPASNAVATRLDLDPFNDFHTDNVRAMAAASQEIIATETFIVEAPLPFALPLLDVPEADRPRLEAQWRDAVDDTAPLASVYGFDVYAIDAVTDVSPIGDYIDIAEEVAPQALPIAVLQGFGAVDMAIAPTGGGLGRQPTLDETRAMAFEALVRGAGGLFWYGQSSLTVEEPGCWEHVRAVVRELREVEPIIVAAGSDLDVGNGAVHASTRALEDGAAFVIVVNPTAEAQTVTLAGGIDELTGDDVERDPTLAPYQVLIVRE